jgi:hypothetical protein
VIRALRRRHLRAFTLLAVVLPAILVAALTTRRTPPVVASAPTALTDPTLDTWVAFDSAEAQALEVSIRIRLLAPAATTSGPMTRLGVELEPTRAIGRPDVLVYWTALAPGSNEALPSDALLIGAMGGTRPRRFELPRPAQSSGSLVLYSAAHREVLGTLPVPRASVGATPSP